MNAATRQLRNDRQRVMVTPEGIALPVVLASRGARFGALMIDLILIGLAMILATVAIGLLAGGTAKLGFEADQAKGAARHALDFLFILWVAAIFLFRNAYFLFFELGPRGATPGKRMVGIRIAARDGGRLSAEMVIARNLLRDIELFLPAVLLVGASAEGTDMGPVMLGATAWFLVFALFPFFNRDRLRAGDLIAGSWVLEAPKRKLEAAMSLGHAARGTSAATASS